MTKSRSKARRKPSKTYYTVLHQWEDSIDGTQSSLWDDKHPTVAKAQEEAEAYDDAATDTFTILRVTEVSKTLPPKKTRVWVKI